MEKVNEIVGLIDTFVWAVMLVLLVGTGIFLTIRLRFLPWRNLGYALHSVLSKEARTTKRGTGDVSPFSALMTALAATIGTGNIIGVARQCLQEALEPGVDVDLSMFRPNFQIQRMHAGYQIPRD